MDLAATSNLRPFIASGHTKKFLHLVPNLFKIPKVLNQMRFNSVVEKIIIINDDVDKSSAKTGEFRS